MSDDFGRLIRLLDRFERDSEVGNPCDRTEIEEARRLVQFIRDEDEVSTALANRQDDLLRGVLEALRGAPPDGASVG